MRFALLALAAGATLLSGCDRWLHNPAPDAAIDQVNLCQVTDGNAATLAAACKPGQKVLFMPQIFGNEQLPVVFAAGYCDLRYEVALTKGAVTCIYQPASEQSLKGG